MAENGELAAMRSEAMKRVYEMQKRARQSFEENAAPAAAAASSEKTPPMGLDDPILSAALAYLLG